MGYTGWPCLRSQKRGTHQWQNMSYQPATSVWWAEALNQNLGRVTRALLQAPNCSPSSPSTHPRHHRCLEGTLPLQAMNDSFSTPAPLQPHWCFEQLLLNLTEPENGELFYLGEWIIRIFQTLGKGRKEEIKVYIKMNKFLKTLHPTSHPYTHAAGKK